MADKNLHDIKIDELDSPKKTPLKNILTLLALLFIILVISVVITKLILSTEEGASIENNDSRSELLRDAPEENKTEVTKESSTSVDKEEIVKDKIPVINSNVTERNLTSAIKTPLIAHAPKEMRTYATPKKNSVPKKEVEREVKKSSTVKRESTPPKKEYIDRVIVKKEPTRSSSKSATYLGGKQKPVTNSYYIKVGTYRDPSTVVAKVKKNNFNYSLVKVENDTTLTRVLVGPFFSRNQANTQLAKVKANILEGAYITKAK